MYYRYCHLSIAYLSATCHHLSLTSIIICSFASLLSLLLAPQTLIHLVSVLLCLCLCQKNPSTYKSGEEKPHAAVNAHGVSSGNPISYAYTFALTEGETKELRC